MPYPSNRFYFPPQSFTNVVATLHILVGKKTQKKNAAVELTYVLIRKLMGWALISSINYYSPVQRPNNFFLLLFDWSQFKTQ